MYKAELKGSAHRKTYNVQWKERYHKLHYYRHQAVQCRKRSCQMRSNPSNEHLHHPRLQIHQDKE